MEREKGNNDEEEEQPNKGIKKIQRNSIKKEQTATTLLGLTKLPRLPLHIPCLTPFSPFYLAKVSRRKKVQ